VNGGLLLWSPESVLAAALVTITFLLAVTAGFMLVALGLRFKNAHRAAAWARREAAWDPLIVDVAHGLRPPEDLLALVDPREALPFLEYLLRYARRLRGPELTVLHRLAEPFLPRLVGRASHRAQPVRALAVQALGALGLPPYEDVVIAALDDPAPYVALVACKALVQGGGDRYLEPVLARLHRFDHLRGSFLAAMLASTGPGAGPALRRALVEAPYPVSVRIIAARTLMEMHDLPAADVAADLLRHPQDRELAAALLRLLAQVGRPEHRPAARPYLEDEDFVLRAMACRVMGAVGTAEDQEVLARMLFGDASRWVAINAAHALLVMGGQVRLRALAGAAHERASLAAQVLAAVHHL